MTTVVGVLIEVPVMLMLVRFCLKTRSWFEPEKGALQQAVPVEEVE